MTAVNQIKNLQITPGTSHINSVCPQWYQRQPQRVWGELVKFKCPFERSCNHLLNSFFTAIVNGPYSVPKRSFNFFPPRQCRRWSPTVRLYKVIMFKLMFTTTVLHLHMMVQWWKKNSFFVQYYLTKYTAFSNPVFCYYLSELLTICWFSLEAVGWFPK